ncbi:MAG: MinD/ParA family protein [Desulfuromonadia bacterium]
MQSDQADGLRQIAQTMKSRKKGGGAPVSGDGIRVIAITSGKGGVGKSNVVINLAILLSRMKKRVLVIDADLGVGNIDVLLGLKPRHSLDHLFTGEAALSEIIIDGPGGIKLIPAGSGVQEYTHLSATDRIRLLDEFDTLDQQFDIVLIDTAAGISENVTYFITAAQEVIVVASPEPTSITDVYALIKLLTTKYGERTFKVLVNMVKDSKDVLEVFARLCNVTSRFLDVSLDYLGFIVWDDRVIDSVKQQKAVCELYPKGAATACFENVARRIIELGGSGTVKGNLQFFFRQKFMLPEPGGNRV